MSKYYTIPFYQVGEDEPRLLPMLNNLDVLLPTPGWFVPSSHIDIEEIHAQLEQDAVAFLLDEM